MLSDKSLGVPLGAWARRRVKHCVPKEHEHNENLVWLQRVSTLLITATLQNGVHKACSMFSCCDILTLMTTTVRLK